MTRLKLKVHYSNLRDVSLSHTLKVATLLAPSPYTLATVSKSWGLPRWATGTRRHKAHSTKTQQVTSRPSYLVYLSE